MMNLIHQTKWWISVNYYFLSSSLVMITSLTLRAFFVSFEKVFSLECLNVYCIFSCRIRKKVYDALLKLQYNFEEAFNNETKTDQLYPVLDFDELNAMKIRIQTILKYVHDCLYTFRGAGVFLDI